jgi:uncharacterized membrane protein
MPKFQPQEIFIVGIIMSIPFFVALWLMIFLNTYRHFPKMEPKERMKLSIVNATYPILFLMLIIYVFFWFVTRWFLKV